MTDPTRPLAETLDDIMANLRDGIARARNSGYAGPGFGHLESTVTREVKRLAALRDAARLCQCEVYQTCDRCRGTERDASLAAAAPVLPTQEPKP